MVWADQPVRINRYLHLTPCSHTQQTKCQVGLRTLRRWLWMGNRVLVLTLLPISRMGDDRLRQHNSHVRGDP